MTEALEQQREETASVELPADVAAPAPADELQTVLDEFDNATSRQPETEPAPDGNVPADENISTDQSLDQQLADLLGSDPKVAEISENIYKKAKAKGLGPPNLNLRRRKTN